MNLGIHVPDPGKQAIIAESIEQRTTLDEAAIARAHRKVALLSEYRNRLIADVVTGKLDVRNAATVLPEVDSLTEDDRTDASLNAGGKTAPDNIEAAEVVH